MSESWKVDFAALRSLAAWHVRQCSGGEECLMHDRYMAALSRMETAAQPAWPTAGIAPEGLAEVMWRTWPFEDESQAWISQSDETREWWTDWARRVLAARPVR